MIEATFCGHVIGISLEASTWADDRWSSRKIGRVPFLIGVDPIMVMNATEKGNER
jgi:hypothetical protein